jgi:ribonuclease III
MSDTLIVLEEKIGIKFSDRSLLKAAFTHRSYLNENRHLKADHNERLEFLGDAVLELAVTDYLYKKYPKKPEGDLTAYRAALVNSVTLAKVATTIDINEFLLLSKGEAKDVGRARQYILANTLEALIGAIYLDQGYESAQGFIDKFILVLTDEIIEEGSWIDSKSKFQEIAQERLGITPMYKTLGETGPDHDKYFTVGVFLDDELVAEGIGRSKQDAEQGAAKKALTIKGW